MIYYYLVNVKYTKGNEIIIKEYRKSFLEIGQLFYYLETKHKNNYLLMSIKPIHYVNGYQKELRF